MKVRLGVLLAVLVLGAFAASARVVTAGTVVCNPGAVVSVPLSVDDLSDVAAAVFTVNYDPTVVACLGVTAGEAVAADRFTYADTGAGQVVLVVPSFRQAAGAIAWVRLLARSGTQELFSDVTVAEADLAAADGLTDLSATNPITTVNGMVRVVAADAAVARLENAFTLWPVTRVESLTLADGDGLMASDDGSPTVVSGAVSAAGAIPVAAPPSGWQTGSYALLETPTAGLSFALAGLGSDDSWTVRIATTGGRTTYWADVTVAGSVAVVAAEGTLDRATAAQVRTALADELAAHPNVKTVTVKGDRSIVPLAVDLGIAPQFDVLGTEATATYAAPTLAIVAFDPRTGLVRIRVTPGEGNSIRAPLVTGCIHVYGTDDLSRRMQYLAGTRFDLTPYLKDGTRGEADLTVALGSHTFIKVKAETTTKQEGEEE